MKSVKIAKEPLAGRYSDTEAVLRYLRGRRIRISEKRSKSEWIFSKLRLIEATDVAWLAAPSRNSADWLDGTNNQRRKKKCGGLDAA